MTTETETPIGASAVPTSIVLEYADQVAKRQGVDPQLLKAIILAENSGNSGVLPKSLSPVKSSPRGAYGVTQLMPDTFQGLKDQKYLNPSATLDTWQEQVEAGAAALRAKAKEWKTTDPIILASAYNGGNNGARLARAGNYEGLSTETKQFLNKVRLAQAGLESTSPASPSQPSLSQPSQADVRRSEPPDPATAPDTRVPTVGVESITSTPPIPTPKPDRRDSAIESFTRGLEQNREVIHGLIAETTRSTAEAVRELNTAAAQAEVAGTLAGEAEKARASVQAATAQNRKKVLQVGNLDTNQAENDFSRLLAERVQMRKAIEPVRREVDERMSVGFFDNPIQWLVNQTILPGLTEKYNSQVRALNDNVRTTGNIQAQVSAQQALELGTDADILLSLSIKEAAVKEAQAKADAAKIRSNASALIANKSMAIANLHERLFSDVERLERWKIILGDKREKEELNEKERAEREELTNSIEKVGYTIGSERATLENVKRLPKAEQAEWLQRAKTMTLGDSFPEAFEFVRKYGDLNNMRLKGAGEIADMHRDWQREVDRRSQNIRATWSTKYADSTFATKIPSDAVAREMAAKEMQAEWEGQRDNNMLIASPTNPYLVNHSKGAKVFTGNQNNVVYRMLKDAASKNQKVNDKLLLDATKTLVVNGVITAREAASAIQEYYSFMIDKNNSDRNLRSVGLTKQEGYIVRFNDTYNQPMKNSVDLTNVVVTENALTQLALMEKTKGRFHPSLYDEESGYQITPYPGGVGYFLQKKDKKPETPQEKLTSDITAEEAQKRRGVSGTIR